MRLGSLYGQFVMLAVSVYILGVGTGHAENLCKVSISVTSITFGGKNIKVDLFTPNSAQAHPLIVMLHGSAGIFTQSPHNAPWVDNFGEMSLASRCFVVALPHYFDILGVLSLTDRQEMQTQFPKLLEGLGVVLSRLEKMPQVIGSDTGLYGESYGGFLAIVLAILHPEVRAVSEISGALAPGYKFSKTPPEFLIQHGKLDDLVPLVEAKRLTDALRLAGGHAELIVYANDGHYFSPNSQKVILEHSVAFFGSALALPSHALPSRRRDVLKPSYANSSK